MLRGAGGAVGNRADRGADARGGVAGVTKKHVHEIVQAVEVALHLGSAARTHVNGDERLHLTGDTADVLTACDVAPVGAAGNETALTANHTADVNADVLIAHGAPVGAANDNAGGETGNAADVGGGMNLTLFVGDVFHRGVIRKRRITLVGCEVHACRVGAIGNRAEVLSDGAAHVVVARCIALGFAVINHAGGLICAGDAADVIRAADRAGEVAAADRAHVGADNRADLTHRAGSVNVAGHGEILDRTALLHIAEEAHMRRVAFERKAADGVTLPVKHAAKGRHRCKHNTVQIQIRLKNDGLVSGISIEFAVIAELLKVFHRSDADGILIRNGGACSAQEAEHNRQKNCDCPTFVTFHLNPPPRLIPGLILFFLQKAERCLRKAVPEPSPLC